MRAESKLSLVEAGEQPSRCCNHHAFQRHQAGVTLAS